MNLPVRTGLRGTSKGTDVLMRVGGVTECTTLLSGQTSLDGISCESPLMCPNKVKGAGEKW